MSYFVALLQDSPHRSALELPVSRLDLSGVPRGLRRELDRQAGKPGVRTVRDLFGRKLRDDAAEALYHAVLRQPLPGGGRPAEPAGARPGVDDLHALPEQPTEAELVAWARRHHVDDLLDAPAKTWLHIRGLPTSLPEEWLTVRRLVAPEQSSVSIFLRRFLDDQTRRSARDGLVTWAEHTREALAIEPERLRIYERPPPEPCLRRPWERLRALRSVFRARVAPHGSFAVTFEVEEDPPAIVVETVGGVEVEPVRLSLETGQGTLDEGWDPWFGLAACDALLAILTDPELTDRRTRFVELLSEPGWKRDLAWLDRVTHVDPDPDDDKNLLAWRVERSGRGALMVSACRVRPKKSGPGYVSRLVKVRDVPVGLRKDPADEAVHDLLSRWAEPPRDSVLQALRALVGHTRVLPPGRGGVPIPVRLAPLTLRLEPGPDQRLRLVPVLDGRALDPAALLDEAVHNAAGGLFARVEDDVVLVAELRDATLRFLRHWRQRSPSLPPEALPEVLRRLPQLMAHAPLTLAPELHGTPVDGDPRLLVRLDGTGDGLRVQLRVRLLPGAVAEEPGAGPTEVYEVRGTRVVHVPRDLDDEERRAGEATELLALPASARVHRWDWWLRDVQQALAVVAALREHPAAFQVEWTGEVPSLRRAAKASDLKLRVRRDRDWFGLEGAVDVDGASVGLDDLLDAALSGQRFVQVADGSWVGIEAALVERLASAGAVPSGRTGKRQLGTLHAPVIEALAEAGAEVEAPTDWLELSERAREAQSLEAPLPAGLVAELRPYQLAGFRWLAALAHWAPGACLADDMGLGKTVQAIALLLHRRGTGPALVVAPMSLVFNWQRELERFAPSLRVRVHHGADRAGQLDDLTGGDVVLTTYGVLVRDAAALAGVAFGTLVLDESQAIKNPDSQRARAARGLQAGFRLALSGTPVENHLGDLWSLLAFVAPGLLGQPAWFRERFAAPIEGQGDPRRRRLLARVVRPFLLRRTKAEVAPELPERVEVVHAVTLSDDERALYEAARRSAVSRLAEVPDGGKRRFQILAELQRLRQLACHPRLVDPGSPVASSKLKQATRLLHDLRDAGHKALVFSSFVRHLELVRDALTAEGFGLCWLDGSTAPERRRAEVDRFQAGEADAFLISLKAGGTGLNLTAATYVLHLDPWWNPASEDQATDRAHRIGQEHAVTVYRLVARGTIEERIVALHAEKRELAEAILTGADEGVRATTEELVALLAEATLDSAPDPLDEVPPPEVGPALEAAEPEVAPGPAAGWTPDEVLARFERHLAEEHAARRLAKAATVRAYRNAVEHLLAWAGRDRRYGPDELEDLGARYLQAVEEGAVPHRSDRVYGRPAFRRLAQVLAAS